MTKLWLINGRILSGLLGFLPICGLIYANAVIAKPTEISYFSDVSGANNSQFQAYVETLKTRARREHVSEATIARMTYNLTLNPQVIALDRSQPGSTKNNNIGAVPDFAPYYRKHVTATRIAAGRAKLADVARYVPGIERQYGVPAGIILAIWGSETDYGRETGHFDLANSLATLAYEGRRRVLFATEFVDLLKIADTGIPRSQLVGSWAGAFGNPQFLPSTWLRLARDGNGDGKIDVWRDDADTMASIANYLRDAGWRRGEVWGVRAEVPAMLDRTRLQSALVAPECPRVYARQSRWLTVGEWRAHGVIPLAPIRDTTLASLIEPDGPGRIGFLLTGNYHAILHYNCSNYYALSVGLLADEISR